MVGLDDFALGILSGVVTEGLKHPVRGLNHAINRRLQLTDVLSGRVLEKGSADPRVRQAIKHLVQVIGSGDGKLTPATAEFFRHLEQTAIPRAMFDMAVSGTGADSLKPAFETVAGAHNLPYESAVLFDALMRSLELAIESSVSDPSMFKAVRLQTRKILSEVGSLQHALSRARDPLFQRPIAELQDIRVRLARGIEFANRYVNVETLQGAKKIKIRSLVVPARLSSTTSEKASAGGRLSHEKDSAIGYLSFRRDFTRAVILGDPGGGKSTVTQLISYDFANQIILDNQTGGHREINSKDLKLPIRVILRSLERRQNSDESYSILDYIVDELHLSLDGDRDLCRAYILRELTLGSCALIFDGLDEVLEVEFRRSIALQIEKFSHIYAACPALVTSRVVGYRDAPMCDDFEILALAAFNNEEILKFSERLIKAVDGCKVQEARTKSQEFMRQTQNIGKDLRENPLMLGLMVYIFCYRGDVPSNRPEIYKECAQLMFEKWDQRRNIIFEIPPDFELLDLFSFVSGEIFGDSEKEDGVSRDWLTEKLKSYFTEWYVDRRQAVQAARSLVDFLTGRAWVMCEIGPGVFKFTHRTFMEYFFARGLISKSESTPTLVKSVLLPKVSTSQWEVISHLALQMAVFRDNQKMIRAFEALHEIITSETLTPAEEVEFLVFASRATEYLVLPEPKWIALVESIVGRALYLADVVGFNSARIIFNILRYSGNKAEFNATILDRLFTGAVRAGGSRKRFVFYMMGPAEGWSTLGAFGGEFSNGQQGRVALALRNLRTTHQQLLLNDAEHDIRDARAYAYVYCSHLNALFDKHGLGLVFGEHDVAAPAESTRLLQAGVLSCVFDGPHAHRMESEKGASVRETRRFMLHIADKLTRREISTDNVIVSERLAHIMLRDAESLVVELHHLTSMRRTRVSKERLGTAVLPTLFLIDFCVRIAPEYVTRNFRPSQKKSQFFAPRPVWDQLLSQIEGTVWYETAKRWIDERYPPSKRGEPTNRNLAI